MKSIWNNLIVVKVNKKGFTEDTEKVKSNTIIIKKEKDLIFDGWIFRCSECNDEMKSCDLVGLIDYVQKHLKTHNLYIGDVIINIINKKI